MPFSVLSEWSKNFIVTIILMAITALGTAAGTAIVTSYTIGVSVTEFSNKLEHVTEIALNNQASIIAQNQKIEEKANLLDNLASSTTANVNRLDREDDYLMEMIRDNSKSIKTLIDAMHTFDRGLDTLKATRVTSEDINKMWESINNLCQRMTQLKTMNQNMIDDIKEVKEGLKYHERNPK